MGTRSPDKKKPATHSTKKKELRGRVHPEQATTQNVSTHVLLRKSMMHVTFTTYHRTHADTFFLHRRPPGPVRRRRHRPTERVGMINWKKTTHSTKTTYHAVQTAGTSTNGQEKEFVQRTGSINGTAVNRSRECIITAHSNRPPAEMCPCKPGQKKSLVCLFFSVGTRSGMRN